MRAAAREGAGLRGTDHSESTGGPTPHLPSRAVRGHILRMAISAVVLGGAPTRPVDRAAPRSLGDPGKGASKGVEDPNGRAKQCQQRSVSSSPVPHCQPATFHEPEGHTFLTRLTIGDDQIGGLGACLSSVPDGARRSRAR